MMLKRRSRLLVVVGCWFALSCVVVLSVVACWLLLFVVVTCLLLCVACVLSFAC